MVIFSRRGAPQLPPGGGVRRRRARRARGFTHWSASWLTRATASAPRHNALTASTPSRMPPISTISTAWQRPISSSASMASMMAGQRRHPEFVIDARRPARLRRPWDSSLTDELDRGLIETRHRTARVGGFAIKVEHIFHPRNVFGIDAGNAPHLALPGLDRLLGQSSTHRLARDLFVPGANHNLLGQQLQCPARSSRQRVREHATATSNASSRPVRRHSLAS